MKHLTAPQNTGKYADRQMQPLAISIYLYYTVLVCLTIEIKEKQTMKFIYPAVFRKKDEGGYHAFFPDLECCEASGDTLDDAIDSANEACRNWITVELEEEDPVLPYVSDIEDIEVEEGDIVRNISVNIRFRDGWDE